MASRTGINIYIPKCSMAVKNCINTCINTFVFLEVRGTALTYTVYTYVLRLCTYKADSYGNENLTRKWTKSVFFIRDQKFGQADSHRNEKLIRKWSKSTGLGAL